MRAGIQRASYYLLSCVESYTFTSSFPRNPETGIESLRSEFGPRVDGIALIGQVKETLAVDLKIAFENEQVAIPRDRDLTSQVHSINLPAAAWSATAQAGKTPTEAGYARFDTEKNERHHADKFWALALAVHAAGIATAPRRQRRGISASIV